MQTDGRLVSCGRRGRGAGRVFERVEGVVEYAGHRRRRAAGTHVCVRGIRRVAARLEEQQRACGFGVALPLGSGSRPRPHRAAASVTFRCRVAEQVPWAKDDGHCARWSTRGRPSCTCPPAALAFGFSATRTRSESPRIGAGCRSIRPCSVGRTYFNGGLLVAGAQCAQLEVSGATQTPVRLVVALGRSHCA